MCLIIIFRLRPYNDRPPQLFKSPLSRWHDYDVLSDKPSQPSPLDVAPTDVHTRGSGESVFPVAP